MLLLFLWRGRGQGKGLVESVQRGQDELAVGEHRL